MSLSCIKGGKEIDIIHNNVGDFHHVVVAIGFEVGGIRAQYMQAMITQPPKNGSVHDIKDVFYSVAW